MWIHLTAHAAYPRRPFEDQELARIMWDGLVREFPGALAAVLMPDHLHLIVPDEKLAKRRLRRLLRAISRQSKERGLWQPSPPPARIPDRHHLYRQVRYVVLNPCRARLCTDPLEWTWSTHRDIVGAVATPWVDPSHLAAVLGEPSRNFAVRFHAYVSGDPSVAVAGTAFPQACPAREFAQESIGEILAAAAAALRAPVLEVRSRSALRRLFVDLAGRQGWGDTAVFSRLCGITPRAVQLLRKRPPARGAEAHARGLAAAALCLGDRRLRQTRSFDLSEGLSSSNFAFREVRPSV